jgi:hypothetical protein
MVAENRGEVVFCAYNHHAQSCGVPVAATNAAPDNYCGYFENEHGEQWVFVYDRTTKRGILKGGDVGWLEAIEVVDGAVPIQLNPAEDIWLRTCWQAATAR